MANQVALIAALKLLADGAKDAVSALAPGQSLTQKFAAFEGLIPDSVELLKDISDIKAEIAALQPADYVSLAGVLVADLGFSNPHAQAVAAAGIKVLSDGVSVALPDVIAFIHAVKGDSAPAAA